VSREIIIAGWGAVSPAGWTAGEMVDAILEKRALPISEESRGSDAPVRRFRSVPNALAQPPWARHTRLRRASPATRFAVSAALEALGSSEIEKETLGVIFVTMNGSVTFSRRFFAEVCENPALASPILFPETVFNAPASHLSSVLASPAVNYTLLGDSAHFLRGLDLAVQWLHEERVPHCLVVAAEELDWLSTEALMLFPGGRIAAEGSAAAYLKLGAADAGVRLEQITEAHLMSSQVSRARAAKKMHAELLAQPDSLICDSRCGSAVWDAPESTAWPDAHAHSSAQWLGDGFGVSAGWQSVLACEMLHRGLGRSAAISAIGCSQQAIGAVVSR